MGTGGPHAGVGCILHVHAPREVMLHVDGPVIQDDLRKENIKQFRDSEISSGVFYSFPQHTNLNYAWGGGGGFKNQKRKSGYYFRSSVNDAGMEVTTSGAWENLHHVQD